jgi:hypothetical protein
LRGPGKRGGLDGTPALYQLDAAEEFNDVPEDHGRKQSEQRPDHAIHRFLHSLKVPELSLSIRRLQLSMKEFSQGERSGSMGGWGYFE